MAHKTLISGTAYSVTGGRDLIGGTGYGCKAGKTLIGGTAFDVKFPRPITVTIHGSSNIVRGTYVQIGDRKVAALGTYETTTGTEITAATAATEQSTRVWEEIYFNGVLVSKGAYDKDAQYSFIAKRNIDIMIQLAQSGPFVANQMRIKEV